MIIPQGKVISRGIIKDLLAAKGGILKRGVVLEEMVLTIYVPWDLTGSKAHKRGPLERRGFLLFPLLKSNGACPHEVPDSM